MSRWLATVCLFLLVVTFNAQSQDVKTIDEKGLTGLLKNRNDKVLLIEPIYLVQSLTFYRQYTLSFCN
ncbi:MAG: hypothetical protein IPG53_16135 [Ignavibacteriales bacterium]|nr:hypothetical protein [Ignavibacteriales bacterium]